MGAGGIFVLLAVGVVCLQNAGADTCQQQLDGFKSCVRSQMSRDTNDPTTSDTKRQQIQNDFNSCASANGCRSPYPADSERQARTDCLNDARSAIRSQVQWCVQYNYREFQLPSDDYDKDAYWNYLLLRTFSALKSLGDNRYNRNRNNRPQWDRTTGTQQANDICGNDDNRKNQTLICLKSKGTFNNTAAKSSWRKSTCRIKRLCNQVNDQCRTQWDTNYKPRLCDCVNTLKSNGSLNTIQNNYVECVRRRGVSNIDQQNDDGRQVIAKILNSWCSSGKLNRTQINQTDPCQRNSQRGNGQNGNNGQTSVQTQTQTQTNVNSGYDDGTSAQAADVDPFSGIFGGASDPLAQAAGGGLFGGGLPSLGGGGGGLPSLGGGLPSLGGGGLPSLGGGLPSLGGGGLPSLGGGLPNLGGGGLFGGGAGNGLLSAFGGSNPASALTSGGLGGLLGGGSPLSAASSLGGLGGGADIGSVLGGGGASNLLGGLGGFGGMKKKK